MGFVTLSAFSCGKCSCTGVMQWRMPRPKCGMNPGSRSIYRHQVPRETLRANCSRQVPQAGEGRKLDTLLRAGVSVAERVAERDKA